MFKNNMTDVLWSKELVLKLIGAYEMRPLLYVTTHPDYMNRVKKADAFDEILTDLKLIEPSITLPCVKRKIHTLRNQFLRDLRRVDSSKKSGAGVDELYEPKLWCYDQLLFLKTYCKIRESTSNIEEIPNEDEKNEEESSDVENKNPNEEIKTKRKKKTQFSTARRLDNVSSLLKAKLEGRSPYVWLGKQVVFEIDRMQSEEIQRKASWEIQKILRKCSEEDLQKRKLSTTSQSNICLDTSLETEPSTSKGIVNASNDVLGSPSKSDGGESVFIQDVLENAMQGVFDPEDFF